MPLPQSFLGQVVIAVVMLLKFKMYWRLGKGRASPNCRTICISWLRSVLEEVLSFQFFFRDFVCSSRVLYYVYVDFSFKYPIYMVFALCYTALILSI